MQTQLLVVLHWEALVYHANPPHKSQMRQLNDSLSISRSLLTSEVQRVIMHETATAHSSVTSPSLSINHPHTAAAMLSHQVSSTGTDLANQLVRLSTLCPDLTLPAGYLLGYRDKQRTWTARSTRTFSSSFLQTSLRHVYIHVGSTMFPHAHRSGALYEDQVVGHGKHVKCDRPGKPRIGNPVEDCEINLRALMTLEHGQP
ncbi:uncharacterized protein EDB91DRAFT_1087497 [Suillus paluster]|uniref:uncharacterized protein n=1 Tax=Suillus paluster TaxID=48578 RepID=UPI001B8661DF|nr:uncharacterized protein EDB91DRAFT_1087497 [Suillus paluster]KAG1724312.1 hypothetical protein EDB91DRAFT_1087497 [Suillus paluster]